MARSAKKARTIATFTYPVKVEVREPQFELLDSVRHLDIKALESAASAEVELGYVKTSCCQHLVRAVIRKGMVTGLRIEEFAKADRSPVSPEFAKVLKTAARKAAAKRAKPPKFPMPVKNVLSVAFAPNIMTLSCVQICIFGWCINCCWRTDVHDVFVCGFLTIDTTSGPYPEPPQP